MKQTNDFNHLFRDIKWGPIKFKDNRQFIRAKQVLKKDDVRKVHLCVFIEKAPHPNVTHTHMPSSLECWEMILKSLSGT